MRKVESTLDYFTCHFCRNTPLHELSCGTALIQLLQQELKSLQDDVKNMSAECEEEKSKVRSELQNFVSVLDEMEQRMERLEIRQQNTSSEIGDVKDRMSVVEDTIYKLEGNFKAVMYIGCIGSVQHSS